MKKSVNHIKVAGKRVLVRVDFNVPLKNGNIGDNSRIVASLPTLNHLLKQGASLVLMSHLGRPGGKEDRKYTLAPVARELKSLLKGVQVELGFDAIGEEVKRQVSSAGRGSIILLENLRFHPGETSKDIEERRAFAKQLAEFGDIYVNDAFGVSHREHASVTTITEFLPSAAGLLMQNEIFYWEKVLREPGSPFILILGGAKVSDKIPVIKNLIDKVDHILIGGGMAYTFLAARGKKIGNSLLDRDLLPTCKELLDKYSRKISLPNDVKVGKMDFKTMKLQTSLTNVDVENMPDELLGLDIGEKTVKTFEKIIEQAKMIVWNGPLGVFECEQTAKGTKAVANYIANATAKKAMTIVGGGDTLAAIKETGREKDFSHLSTGGGASLEMLQGLSLPGVAALEDLR